MKNITIRDVAKLAGVSHVTVSNVINGRGRMSAETKEKVLKAVKKLKFYPDVMARTLAGGRSNNIALISSYLSSPFVINILSGVERRQAELNKFAYRLEHHSTRGALSVKEDLLKSILYGKKADAVITVTVKPSAELVKEFSKRGIPLVIIENKAVGASSVTVDNYKGAFMATEHLIKSGRKKLAIVNGPVGSSVYDEEENPVVSERLKGFKDALKEYNLKYDDKMSYHVAFYNREEGEKAMQRINNSGSKVNGVFCAAGDTTALGIIYQCRQYGISIPQDIALAGYDDISIAGIMTPPLTTIKQPMADMGKAAFDIVMGAMESKKKKPVDIILQPELIVRESA
ncbi:MAG: LacI family DNA-binding transcriptional regulator [Candidatus Goldbacteria bacterium]|nr:LacI family DNA-binding transcriptional regulator [Candidatus Goldiibacteriota bacterium]